MPLYEHVFLARQDASSQQVEAITKEFVNILSENGGKVSKTEYWGLKNLAYKIKKNRKAHFSLLNIDAPSAAISEMERRMSIQPDIIRFLTVKVEEHELEPSVMMRKQERDESPERFERSSKFGGSQFAEKSYERERGSTFRQRPPREGGSFREGESGSGSRAPRTNRNETTSTEET